MLTFGLYFICKLLYVWYSTPKFSQVYYESCELTNLTFTKNYGDNPSDLDQAIVH